LLSVIDLGLIREVLFHADPPRTQVCMMLTTPFCPYAPQLIEDGKQATMSVVPQPCEVGDSCPTRGVGSRLTGTAQLLVLTPHTRMRACQAKPSPSWIFSYPDR
jgi:hypothetical protein